MLPRITNNHHNKSNHNKTQRIMSWWRRRIWLSMVLALLGFLLQLVHIVNSIQHVQFLHDETTTAMRRTPNPNNKEGSSSIERDDFSSVGVVGTPDRQSRRREEESLVHTKRSPKASSFVSDGSKIIPVHPIINSTTTITGAVQQPQNATIHVQVSNGGRIRPLSIIHEAISKTPQSQPQSQPQPPIQIDRIYYINMDHRSTRRSIMEQWLSEQPQPAIPYQRVSGQKGQTNTCIPKKNGKRCVGISGLAETYLHIIHTMNTTGLTLVVEDDFVIRDMERLIASIQLVPPDWDILRWDCWDKPLPFFERFPFSFQVNTVDKAQQQCEGVDRCWFCGGTHVALWRGGASLQKLKKIWERPPHDGVDCQLSQHSSIQTYCLQVGIGEFHTPLDEPSDIPKTGDTTAPMGKKGMPLEEKVLQRVQAEVDRMSPTQ